MTRLNAPPVGLRTGLLVALLVALPLGPSPGHAAPAAGTSTSVPEIGPLRVFPAPVAARGVVALLSGSSGWTADMDLAAQAIAEAGRIVVGVDAARVLASIAAEPGRNCLALARPLAAAVAAALIDKRQAVAPNGSSAPVLAGARDGAAMAYAILAQAPSGLFAGAIGVGFNGEAETSAPLCPGAEAERVSPGRYRYGPKADMPAWVRLVTDDPEDPVLVAYALDGGARLVAVRGGGDFASAVIAALADAQQSTSAGSPEAGVDTEDLPLVPMPVGGPGETMAVIYSGDGGWRDADKSIGEALAASGVPVVGIDSLRYFWREKTPEEVAAGLDAILDRYPREWNRPHVLLIGYSFGADILPFVVGRLKPENRARIAQISLLGFAARADFRIQVTSWLGDGPSEDALPVLPQLASLDLSRVQCFYGKEEEDTACTDPALSGAEIIALPGGHHFAGDYAEVAKRILDGARRRLASRLTH